jgi:acyl carrier protein
MPNQKTSSEIADQILAFIKSRFLPDAFKGTFDQTSPLLELGILDSLNTAVLLNFIRRDLGIAIPAANIDSTTFRDVRGIAAVAAEFGTASRD